MPSVNFAALPTTQLMEIMLLTLNAEARVSAGGVAYAPDK
jgi:hypothetical protein